ncbi:diaminopimelate decarboxylase family protein [Paraeggerthella sp.]|uniref:diaminopimelate decarboxylase family protein n=1 Tax=Paraeggerthella sp. TaxID=2897350 RepID=UPI003AB3F23F
MIDDATLREALDVCPTPVYLFDQRALNDRIAHLRALLPSHAKICYAMKANPFIVREASFLVDCIEACSPGELRICASAGVPFEKVVLSGLWKDRCCLDELFQAGRIPHRFTIESPQQLKDLVELANEYGRQTDVLFRLSSGNQFGVDSTMLKKLVDSCKDDPFVSIQGIQYYSGTQKTSLKKLDRELSKLHCVVAEVEASCLVKLNEIEYGPGFPVEYFDEDEQRARCMQDAPIAELATLLNGFPFEGDIVLELGRSIAADCGTYLTSVVDAKTTSGQNYAIIDGGMHQISYYGHSMAMKCPVFRKVDTAAGVSQPWNICGALCTVNDIIAKHVPIVDLSVGDVLAFARAGAYCVTEGRALFLSRDLPSVVVRDVSGDMHVVRHRLETALFNSSKRSQDNAAEQDKKEN